MQAVHSDSREGPGPSPGKTTGRTERLLNELLDRLRVQARQELAPVLARALAPGARGRIDDRISVPRLILCPEDRERIEREIEGRLLILDLADGDPDLEPEPIEADADQEERDQASGVALCRVTANALENWWLK